MMYTLCFLGFLLVGVQGQGFGGGDGTFGTKKGKKAVPRGGIFAKILNINNDLPEETTFDTTQVEEAPDLMEGDIVKTADLLKQIEFMKANKDNEIEVFDAINRGAWPNAVVPYTFRDGYTQRKLQGAVNLAVAEYNKLTCIKWQYYDSNSIRRFKHYVTFFIGGGCFSMIGRQARPQKI